MDIANSGEPESCRGVLRIYAVAHINVGWVRANAWKELKSPMWKRPGLQGDEDRSPSLWLPFLIGARRVFLLGGLVLAGFALANWMNQASAEPDCHDQVSALADVARDVVPESTNTPTGLAGVTDQTTRVLLQPVSRTGTTTNSLPDIVGEACATVLDVVSRSDSAEVPGGGLPLSIKDVGQLVDGLTGEVVHTVLMGHPEHSTVDSGPPGAPGSLTDVAASTIDEPLTLGHVRAMSAPVTPLKHWLTGMAGSRDVVSPAAVDMRQPWGPANNIPGGSGPAALAVSGAGATTSSGGGGSPSGAVLPGTAARDELLAPWGGSRGEVYPVRQSADDPAISPD